MRAPTSADLQSGRIIVRASLAHLLACRQIPGCSWDGTRKAPEMPQSVKRADKILLATEFRDVTAVDDLAWIIAECGCEPAESLWITPWHPTVAKRRFLARFQELTA